MSEMIAACPLTQGRRILVAVDGSHNADQAVQQAISLGAICNSQIYALSVAELNAEFLADAPKLYERLEKEARGVAESTRDKVAQAGLACEALSRVDASPGHAIIETAKEREIDLIVLGTRGRSLLKRLTLGGVAQHVVGQAPCPVMVVPGSV
ncbi:MAG: universal stress protein [Proteobacteria bacterium]|nr:universal stress protein [Pseudomonadota bacterium]MBU1742691.1 universal stress protein [Pseudomonadota bacterium]